ncbi:hypothetical protein [Hyphomicrobium sp. D-2]|uniref:hypothetical protein n=1 Tax=Hyphomicrobium sp. D-2 TaxID=3041621 RepID=UPI002458C31A|nr:hypothetical protein [Hyphomicrobium sp. D-2]MDH4981678.1 hypothetical protein [Hyphomicrobium sp. D-2]
MRFLLLSLAIVFAAGCATIVKGTTQMVAIDTPGAPGASCELSSPAIGARSVVTPATIELDKSQHNIAVTCRKPCFQDSVAMIPSYAEGMAAGNIIAGGVIGLGVDAATGAMNKYADRTSVTMIPVPGCSA